VTYYIRNKKSGKDILLKLIDVPSGIVTVENDDGDHERIRLVDVIEEYEFRYDIW
jgi:hypothetical protein